MYYLEHQGSRWIVFSSQKNREFKLTYLRKLFDNNNILCLQEVHGKDEYLQVLRCWLRSLGFLVSSFLETKMQGDRQYSFTRIFCLRMHL